MDSIKKPKVLFVNPGAAPYGSGQSMLGLLNSGMVNAEAVCPGEGVLAERLNTLRIKLYPLEFGKYAFIKRPDWHVQFFMQFRRILAKSRPDVLVINLDGNTPLITIAALMARIPIIRFSRFEFRNPKGWLQCFCWLKVSTIVCPSNLVRDQVIRWAPKIFRHRVFRLYDPHTERPVTPEETCRFRQMLQIQNDRLITYVGRLDPRKRVETAIEALAIIRRILPDVRLLIVGSHNDSPEGKDYQERLKKLSQDLGVQDAVIFYGYMDHQDVPVAMASSHICVLPSESESFGMVLMEAWSVRVPTVASDVGGCREITKASDGGFLFTVGDAETLATHALRLLTDVRLAQKMGQAGAQWVGVNCHPLSYARHFNDILEFVVEYK